MSIKEKIKDLIARDSLVYNKPSNLFLFLANALSVKFETVEKTFNELVKSGEVFEIRKGKFIPIPSKGYYKATFIGNSKGFGFCDLENFDQDVFIPANKTLGAIDGDGVIIKVYTASEDGCDGEVVKVFNPVKTMVGTVEKVSKNFFLDPDNGKIPTKFLIVPTGLKCKENDKVVIKLNRQDNKITGKVIEVLGQSDNVKTLELAIIRDHNLYEEFPTEVIRASEKVSTKITEKQRKNRVDFTKDKTFTVDGEDAKDLDDAVSIKKIKNGYILGVHIADVGEYVKMGDVLDEEAFKRGTSTYFPTSVLPMLPKALSNGICSLNENEERLTLSCIMTLDEKGNVLSHKICEGIIKSKARLTYNQVYDVIMGKETEPKAMKLKKEILMMADLAKVLEDKMKKQGALDLDIPEPMFVFDENGYVVDVKKRESNISHKIIEEFMVLANETVAKEYSLKDFPFVYRVHEEPRPEKVRAVCEYLRGLSINTPKIPDEITPDYFQELISLVEEKSYKETVNKVILRAMQKARYATSCLGHFGLALKYYCHFTSPIRRYPDLTIHRIIKEDLNKKIKKQRLQELKDFADESAMQSSEMERNAEKAERDVDDLWRAYLMKDRIGEEFDGIITGVNNFGFFVELENSCEGLVKVETLPDDNYLYFERSMMLKGQNHSFKIGDKVRVKLVSSNIYLRKIAFECVF